MYVPIRMFKPGTAFITFIAQIQCDIHFQLVLSKVCCMKLRLTDQKADIPMIRTSTCSMLQCYRTWRLLRVFCFQVFNS